MKKLFIVGLLVAALSFGLSGVAMAANPVVTSPAVDVTATVAIPLTITVVRGLDFPVATHILVPGGLTRTVAHADGTAAQLTVAGEVGAPVTITVPLDVIITHTTATAPAPTMTVTLTPNPAHIGTVTLTTVASPVHIGGSITAITGQAPGAYAGTFTITAVYL